MSLAPAAENAISLSQMRPQESAVIAEVGADKSDAMRLTGLGICSGRKLQLLKGGDPMILQVYGTRIGLSARLAKLVRVIPGAIA